MLNQQPLTKVHARDVCGLVVWVDVRIHVFTSSGCGSGLAVSLNAKVKHELYDLRIEQLLFVSLLPRRVIASKWHLSVLLQQLFTSSQSGITMLVLFTCAIQ